MKESSIRWKQADLLVSDAESVAKETYGAFGPHAQLVAREAATRVNLQQYGFNDAGPMQVVTFGGIFLEGKYTLLDLTKKFVGEAAQTNTEIQKLNTQQVKSDLLYSALVVYVNCQRLSARRGVYEKSLERDKTIVEMAQSKVKAGFGLQTDLMRAQGLLGMDNLKLIEATLDLEKCRNDLAGIIGVTSIKDDLEPLTYSPFSVASDDPFTKTGVDDRSDVKASRLTVIAAKSISSAAKSVIVPTIEVFGEAGIGGSNAFRSGTTGPLGIVGIQLKLPLYDSGILSAKSQLMLNSVQKAELQAKQTRIDAESQISASLARLKSTKTAADLAQEQVNLVQKELSILSNRYSTGLASGVELYTAQTNLSASLLNEIEVAFANEVAKLSYFRAISEIDSYVNEAKVSP